MNKIVIITLFFVYQFNNHLEAQIAVPDFPNDKLEHDFYESPLTLQYDWNSTDPIKITGYAIRLDLQTQLWQDTILKVEQSASNIGNQKQFTERVWEKQPNGIWHNRNLNYVYQTISGLSNSALSPDSLFLYTWNQNENDWQLHKKIKYFTSSPDTLKRTVFFDNHEWPDTIESIYLDTTFLETIRLRYFFNSTDFTYHLADSSQYVFVNGLCRLKAIFNCTDDTCKIYKRQRFQYANDPQNYTREDDFWPNSSIGWLSPTYKFGQVVTPDFKIFKQYDSLTNIAWQTYLRINATYDENWQPNTIDFEFYPSLVGLPDSSSRRIYVRVPGSNKINQIIHYNRSYQDDWNAVLKWEFIENSVPISTESPTKQFANYRLRTIGLGSYELAFDGEPNINWSAQIFNALGTHILTQNNIQGNYNFNLNGYPKGIYFIHLFRSDRVSHFVVPICY